MSYRALFGVLALLAISTPAGASIARYSSDVEELADLRAFSPSAADDLEKGEEAALAGKLPEAVMLFNQAVGASPESALPKRRYCEALTAMGQGLAALPTCYMALQIRRTNIAVRAVVRALVQGPQAPTLARLDSALSLLTQERRKAGLHFMLSSALCDVAERIGDGIMLQHCAQELLQLAPQAPETRRALDLLDARCPPGRFWAGWTLIAAAILGTGGHALRRRGARGRRGRLPSAFGIGALLVGLLATSVAAADPAPPAPAPSAAAPAPTAEARPRPGEMFTNLPLSDTDPESNVPTEEQRNKDPLQFGYWLQDALMKGDHAWKEKNFALAVKFYRAVAKAVPDRSVAFSKMCDAYEAMGDRDKAIASCLSALFVEGVRFSDYARYVRLVLSQPTGLTDGQISALDTVLTQFKADPKAHPLVDQLECEVGTRTANLSYLDECTRELLARTPNDPGIIPFQFAIALRRGDFTAARQFADQAKQAGSSVEGVEGMQHALDLATRRRTLGVALWGGGAFLLLLGLGIGGAYFLRRRAAPPQAQPA